MKRAKRLFSMVLMLCMVLGLLPTTTRAIGNIIPFTDVKTTDWCYEGVQYAYENGLMGGTENTKFSPDAKTTRGMIVTILYRLEGEPKVSSSACFSDITDDQYCSNAVTWAAETGIVMGYDDGTFRPNNGITRQQMVAILYRYVILKGYDVTGKADLTIYPDCASVAAYAQDAMGWSVANGIVGGTTQGTLNPTGTATRAQFAMVLMRFCKNIMSLNMDAGKKHTVTFEYNFGNKGTYKTLTVKNNHPVQNPGIPYRSGYSFKGWYVKAFGGERFDFNTLITGDITLYAQWSVNRNGIIDNSGNNRDDEPDNTKPNPTFKSLEEEVNNLAELNEGVIPDIHYDNGDVADFIDGKFSSKTVHNVEDAIDALNDVHHIMQFENSSQEFEEIYSETVNLGEPTNYYRLQQIYHGIPVYGYQLIVSTNESGETQSLSGSYYSGLNLNTIPSITEQHAQEIVINHNEEGIHPDSEGLYIYVTDENATLCWKISTHENSYFVNAETGIIMEVIPQAIEDVSQEEIAKVPRTGTGKDLYGKTVTFPLDVVDEGDYIVQYMYDSQRAIRIAEATGLNQSLPVCKFSTDGDEWWSLYPDAITAYRNMITVYDYYSNVLGRDGADNKHLETYIIVHYFEEYEKDGRTPAVYSNASYFPYKMIGNQDVAFIAFGDGRNYAQPLDILGHEFTHAVSHYVWNPNMYGDSGALNESYSDIIGNLIEEGKLTLIGEDLDGSPIRSLANPSLYGGVDHLSDKATCIHSSHNKNCDFGHVHVNSGIVDHAAYLMDQNWPTPNHANELAALFYKSMFYLPSDCTFSECRHAVLSAAKSMNMSEEKLNVIAQAFSDVGVECQTEEKGLGIHHIIGEVKDASTKKPIVNVQLAVTITNSLGGKAEYSGYTDSDGKFDIKVYRGIGSIEIEEIGYVPYRKDNIDVSAWFDLNCDIGTIELTPNDGPVNDGFVSGIVTNKFSGDPLEGVTIKFRRGSGNQEGPYVKVGSNDIELTTDRYGQYYTAALDAGNYTMEASKKGFITGYLNVISGNSDTSAQQDIALAYAGFGMIKGTVLSDSSKLPLDSVTVNVKTGAEAKIVLSTHTDSLGKYAVILSPGIYTIELKHNGYKTILEENITLSEGDVLTLSDVSMIASDPEMPKVFSGTVNQMGYDFGEWSAYKDVKVTLTDANNISQTMTTGDDGTFSFSVEPGQVYQLKFSKYLYMAQTDITVTIPADYDYRNSFTCAYKTKAVPGLEASGKYRDKMKAPGLIIYGANSFDLIMK